MSNKRINAVLSRIKEVLGITRKSAVMDAAPRFSVYESPGSGLAFDLFYMGLMKFKTHLNAPGLVGRVLL